MEDYRNPEDGGYWAGNQCAASGVLPISRETGRLCFAWRSPAVHIGNCWGTIGGALRPGLSPEANAQTELREETGYDGPIELYPVYVFFDRGFRYHNFIGLVDTEFSLSADRMHLWETVNIQWFLLSQARKLLADVPSSFHFGLVKLFENSGDLIAHMAGRFNGTP